MKYRISKARGITYDRRQRKITEIGRYPLPILCIDMEEVERYRRYLLSQSYRDIYFTIDETES